MTEDLLLIGYRLSDALSRMHDYENIVIEETKSPSRYYENDSVCLEPIVIKQRESEDKVILTVSCFK